MISKKTIKAIEDFLIVKSDKIRSAPLVLIFGGVDLKLSDCAADLFQKKYCEYILISGGKNKSLRNITEAQWHKDNLIEKGVPANRILMEQQASNSLENILFSKEIIKKRFKQMPRKIIIICKAFHGRRIIMTLRKNLSKDIEYILQVIQTKNHQIVDWWRQQNSRDHIIDEIRKIGEYTLKGDIG